MPWHPDLPAVVEWNWNCEPNRPILPEAALARVFYHINIKETQIHSEFQVSLTYRVIEALTWGGGKTLKQL